MIRWPPSGFKFCDSIWPHLRGQGVGKQRIPLHTTDEGRVKQLLQGAERQDAWVLFPSLPFPGCVIAGKPLPCAVPPFPPLKNEACEPETPPLL